MSSHAPYEQTCIEIQRGYIVHRLWARAVCESKGNQRETQRLYLHYRSEELKQQARRWRPGDHCRRQQRQAGQRPAPSKTNYASADRLAQPGQLLSVMA